MNIDAYVFAARSTTKTENDLLRAQISDYRAFVTELVELGQISHQKRFYLIIPYDPLQIETSFFTRRTSTVTSIGCESK